MPGITVRRLDVGYFVRPAAETDTGRPRVELSEAQTADYTHDTASAYGADAIARTARLDTHPARVPLYPAWIDRLEQFDPRAVYFAHDRAVWTP